MSVAITVPVDPKMLLTSNQRLHFQPKANRTAHWRLLAAQRAMLNGDWTDEFTRAHITVTFTYPDKRRRDVGNLYPTAKALVDGLVDAGLLADDDDTHLIGPDLRRDPERGPHAIRIDIEAIEPGPPTPGPDGRYFIGPI